MSDTKKKSTKEPKENVSKVSLGTIVTVIDNREKGHIKEYYKNKSTSSDSTIQFRNLDLGDILYELVESEGNKPILLIERKREEDLATSITSKRHREQKMRLIELKKQNPSLLIWYIVEGFSVCETTKNETVGNSRINRDTLLSSILNTVLRDQFYTINTKDIEETIYILDRLPSKLKEHGIGTLSTSGTTPIIGAGGGNIVPADYASTVQLKKKDNLTPKVCFQLMLAQIPGVSTTMAGTIVNQYNSLGELCMEFYRIEDLKKRKIMLTKVEGIGKIIAGRIHDYIFNVNFLSGK